MRKSLLFDQRVAKKRRKQAAAASSSKAGSSKQEPDRTCWNQLINSVPFRSEKQGAIKDSRSDARNLLGYLLHPVPLTDYYSEYYEKKHLLVQRAPPNHFAGLFSTAELRSIIEQAQIDDDDSEPMYYTRDLDVTNYVDGKRVTLNPSPPDLDALFDDDDDDDDDEEAPRRKPTAHDSSNDDDDSDDDDGDDDDDDDDDDGPTPPELDESGKYVRVNARDVWSKYEEGCSIRLKTVAAYSPKLCRMLSLLEELWGSGGGANVYLTPEGSQGFAPHYDDVEVFICQLEGAKEWRLYPNRTPAEFLDRYSSRNFGRDEVAAEPMLTVTLHAGDVLVLPRGTIHEARSLPDQHSLHITFSAGYRSSYADWLHFALPLAVERAAKEHVELRRSVPMDLFDFAGVVHAASATATSRQAERSKFAAHVAELAQHVVAALSIDESTDQMARNFIHGRYPPAFVTKLPDEIELSTATYIRLARRHIVRLVTEDDGSSKLYYSTENSSRYHSAPAQFIELDPSAIPSVRALVVAYPDYTLIADLPLENASDDDKIELAGVLASFGLLAWK